MIATKEWSAGRGMCASRAWLLSVVMCLLGGCHTIREQWDISAGRTTGAAPLEGEYALCSSPPKGTPVGDCKTASLAAVSTNDYAVTWLGEAVADSISKCYAFNARMAYSRSIADTALDVTGIGLAGVAAITVPLRAAQTLAALAGIATASKGALDSNLFMAKTSPVIAQAIYADYLPKIEGIASKIEHVTVKSLPALYLQLEAIHTECTLNAALSSLIASGAKASAAFGSLEVTDLLLGAVIVDPVKKLKFLITKTFDPASAQATAVFVSISDGFPDKPKTTIRVDQPLIDRLNADGASLLIAGKRT